MIKQIEVYKKFYHTLHKIENGMKSSPHMIHSHGPVWRAGMLNHELALNKREIYDSIRDVPQNGRRQEQI